MKKWFVKLVVKDTDGHLLVFRRRFSALSFVDVLDIVFDCVDFHGRENFVSCSIEEVR